MKKLISDISSNTAQGITKMVNAFDQSTTGFKGMLGKLPFIASVDTQGDDAFDVKHFFVVPYRLNEIGYTLHSMRALPNGVGPVNDLPKKRVFHFPSEHAEEIVKKLLLEQVSEEVENNGVDGMGDGLIRLANEIDRSESKITNGLLLIGGVVALVNPLVGAGVAAQALIPSLGGRLSSIGLKNIGGTLNKKALEKEIKKTEKLVLEEFHSSDTSFEVNLLLKELDLALDTDETQYTPEIKSIDDALKNNSSLTRLTCKAIFDVYVELMNSKKLRKEASVGVEDIEWLNQIARIANKSENIAKRMSILNTLISTAVNTLEASEQGQTIEDLKYISNHLEAALTLPNKSRAELRMSEEIVDDLLPTAINAFLALQDNKTLSYRNNGQTGEELFAGQLEAIRKFVESMFKESNVEDVRQLQIQMSYLNELIPKL